MRDFFFLSCSCSRCRYCCCWCAFFSFNSTTGTKQFYVEFCRCYFVCVPKREKGGRKRGQAFFFCGILCLCLRRASRLRSMAVQTIPRTWLWYWSLQLWYPNLCMLSQISKSIGYDTWHIIFFELWSTIYFRISCITLYTSMHKHTHILTNALLLPLYTRL